MNQDWNQQPGYQPKPERNEHMPAGSLLRDYRQQQQQPPQLNQFSPIAQRGQQPPQQSVPNPYSPMPSGFAPQQGQPQPGPGPLGPQHWVANTVNMVRRWTGKMIALNNSVSYQPPQPFAVNYPAPSKSGSLETKSKPWKRSRVMRLTMHRKHRRARLGNGQPGMQKIMLGALLALVLFMVISLFSGSAYAYSYYQSQLPRLQGIASQHISQTTRIYDRHMNLLAELYDPNEGGRRTPVQYKDIPQVMQDAMISAEDHTFWTNSGIDPQGILRAATDFAQRNAVQGGGSTITQQLVKNLTGDAQVSLNRKLPEATLAIGLTQQYPKSKILEMYFNVAAFGSQDLGIEAAVEDYFGLKMQCDKNFNCTPGITNIDYNLKTKKHDPLLGLARASMLAGIPQNPPGYDPTLGPTHKQALLARQEYVLNQMQLMGLSVPGLGPITPQVVQQAEALTAKMTFTRYNSSKKAPHFVDYVVEQLAMALGNGTTNSVRYSSGLQALLTGGFNIRTTIDSTLEDYVEKATVRHITQYEYQPFTGVTVKLNQYNNLNTAATVVMNSKTGEILAMNGSLDYNNTNLKVKGTFNAATEALRPPGSTFKPIVYATAFQMGWNPGIVLPDFDTYFPNGNMAGATPDKMYHTTDYGGGFNNQTSTIRMATANSFNVPAVKAASFVGLDNMLNTAHRLGIQIDKAGISQALGSSGVSLIQMVGAYQAFADQGMRVPPQSVLDIWDNYGHHIFSYDPLHPHAEQVFSPQVAYMMTSVLTDEHARSFEFAGVHTLSFWDWDPTCSYKSYAPYPDCQVHQVATKTGTTDYFKDNWTIGYTPNVVVGVWAGNADDTGMTNGPTGITGAAPIWHSVMEFVSGRPCAEIDPQIPCPAKPLDLRSLNLTQPTTFAQPTGLHIGCTSGANGLKGSGHCDWMLDGQDPMQVGVGGNNNNNGGDNNGNNGGNGNNNGNNGGNNGNNNNGNNGGNNGGNNNGNNNGGNNFNNNGNNGNNNGN